MEGSVIRRARSNQPKGYNAWEHHNAEPVNHYCVHHNYLYYPYDWTDERTGAEYKRGYYDEEGEYYEDVVFRTDGKYKNVICQCEYCGTITKLDWTEGGPLICSQCGGSMKILSNLDEYTQDPNYESSRHKADYEEYAARSGGSRNAVSTGGRYAILLVIFLIVTALGLNALFSERSSPGINDPGGSGEPLSNPELFGLSLYLRQAGEGVYVITDRDDADKVLRWSYDGESYRDIETGLYLWYNTEVEPPLWQYWYEPISGNYGDYGWMEYEDGRWYIETQKNIWLLVPEEYDVSQLWRIEEEPLFPEGSSDDLSPFGSVIYLRELYGGAFRICDDSCYDRVLIWDEWEACYYDKISGLWLWYNAEVEPPLWQYWYAPISGDFGDYGWMEYEDGVWYVEAEAGDWVPVPEEYDVSELWHLEDEAVPDGHDPDFYDDDSPEDRPAGDASPEDYG